MEINEANCFGHEEEKVTNPFEGRLGSRLRAWSSQDFRRVVVVQGEKMTWNGVEDSYENHRVTRRKTVTRPKTKSWNPRLKFGSDSFLAVCF